jgi:polygalacturonase
LAGAGLAALPLAPVIARGAEVALDIRDFGAVGDGVIKDTVAIQMALDRCAVLGGGTVMVPAGTYLVGAVRVGARTTLVLDEGATLQGSPDPTDYPVTEVRWEGKWIKGHIGLISARDATRVGIAGKGRILGSPSIKGRVDAATGLRNPALLEFVNCVGLSVRDVSTRQNDMWSIHPVYCDDVSFLDVTVDGGADGIDVDSCRRVVIDGCVFDTSDDCISLKSGRGMEGSVINRPTEDVVIRNCIFRDKNWACIGIGSETSGGIRKVRVDNCKCLAARTYAIYIKTRPGRGAFIEDIVMTRLDVSGAGQGFLRLNTLDSGKQDEAPVPGLDGVPNVRDLHFSHIRVSDVPVLVDGGSVHPAKPLDGFSLDDITGTCGEGIRLANTRNAVIKDIQVTGFDGPLLMTRNVTGEGLDGAELLPEGKAPETVPESAAPYVLH